MPFFCKKHPIWGKLGAFLAKFSKIHPILQIGRIGYVTITHPSIYQNLQKCTSKPLSIPVYHVSVRPPRFPISPRLLHICFNVSKANSLHPNHLYHYVTRLACPILPHDMLHVNVKSLKILGIFYKSQEFL